MYKSGGPMSMSMPETPEQDELMEGSDSSYLRPPRRPKESLLRSLRARELGTNRAKCPVVTSRRLYRSIYPNSTIHAVDCQFSNLKRFTPCGQVTGIPLCSLSIHQDYSRRCRQEGRLLFCRAISLASKLLLCLTPLNQHHSSARLCVLHAWPRCLLEN